MAQHCSFIDTIMEFKCIYKATRCYMDVYQHVDFGYRKSIDNFESANQHTILLGVIYQD